MGRPPSRPGLNSKTQRELCWWLAQGHSKEDAAKKAGLPDTYRLHAFARTRSFADELQAALRDHMGTIAPQAVRILDDIMKDKEVQPRVRVDAAKALLDRAGYSAGEERKRVIADPEEMAEWSEDDLRKFIASAEHQLRAEDERRAQGATLVEAPPEAQFLD